MRLVSRKSVVRHLLVWGVLGAACNSFDDPSDGRSRTPRFEPGSPAEPTSAPPIPTNDVFLGAGGNSAFEAEACDFLQLSAAAVGEGARFEAFFGAGILGRLGTGEFFLQAWPDGWWFVQAPPGDVAHEFRSYVGTHVLACSSTECVLFAMPTAGSVLERVPGGTVPGGAGYTTLRLVDFQLCVGGAEVAELCFDRVSWTTSDGGVITGPAASDASVGSQDAGIDASPEGDGGEGGVRPGAPDAASGGMEPLEGGGAGGALALDASPRVGDAGLPDAAPAHGPCGDPIYCDAEELADDPICLSGSSRLSVTRAGRMVSVTSGADETVRCTVISPPVGSPLGFTTSACGADTHAVVLTAEGLFESCGCIWL